MKKVLVALSLIGLLGLLAGCESENGGMGGTSEQYHSNATYGTGSSTATNATQGQGMAPQ